MRNKFEYVNMITFGKKTTKINPVLTSNKLKGMPKYVKVKKVQTHTHIYSQGKRIVHCCMLLKNLKGGTAPQTKTKDLKKLSILF